MRQSRYRTPSPQAKTISGLNGTIPTVWDDGWQLYTDLSQAQIAAFMAMPEWVAKVAQFDAQLQTLNLPLGTL